MLSLFLSYLLIYKYVILAIAIFSASIGLPIPATALLLAAGAFVSEWYFSASLVVLTSFVSSLCGDVFLFFFSYKFGHTFISKIGLKKIIASKKFQTMEAVLVKQAFLTVFFTRFLATSLWPSVSLLSGLARMHYVRFLLYAVFWELLYALWFPAIWYMFSDNWQDLWDLAANIIAVAAIFVVLIFVLLYLNQMYWAKLKKRFL